MKNTTYAITILALLLVLPSCNKEAGLDYINLSVVEYTFDYTGDDSVAVVVETNAGEWEAVPSKDFIHVRKAGDTAYIRVDENNTENSLGGKILFSAGTAKSDLAVYQIPALFRGTFMDFWPTRKGSISKNGKYLAYVNTFLINENDFDDECFVLDFETGEVREIELEIPSIGGIYDHVFAISDDGRVLIIGSESGVTNELYVDGIRTPVSCRPGYSSPWITGMSADGNVIVGGCVEDGSVYNAAVPCKWVNGEHVILDMPERDAAGNPLWNGVYLRGCSADGSVIFGSEWNTFGLVYYKDEKLHNVGIENSEAGSDGSVKSIIYIHASYGNISNSGRYITAIYTKDGVDYPALVDTETGIFRYMESAANCGGAAVTDDAVVFGFTPTMLSSSGFVSDFNTGVTESLSEWMRRVHGISISDNRWVERISSDGKTMQGRKVRTSALGTQFPHWFINID